MLWGSEWICLMTQFMLYCILVILPVLDNNIVQLIHSHISWKLVIDLNIIHWYHPWCMREFLRTSVHSRILFGSGSDEKCSIFRDVLGHEHIAFIEVQYIFVTLAYVTPEDSKRKLLSGAMQSWLVKGIISSAVKTWCSGLVKTSAEPHYSSESEFHPINTQHRRPWMVWVLTTTPHSPTSSPLPPPPPPHFIIPHQLFSLYPYTSPLATLTPLFALQRTITQHLLHVLKHSVSPLPLVLIGRTSFLMALTISQDIGTETGISSR